MLKVYGKDGTLLASTTDYAVAALVVSTFGESGGWVSEDAKSRILWVEGEDGEAALSYDDFGDFIDQVRAHAGVTLTEVRYAKRSYALEEAYARARALAHSA